MEKSGFLTFETAQKIAEKYSTPCYVYDEAALVAQAKKALAFPNAFGLTVRFAMKASSNRAILRLFDSLGLHIDASSAHEVERAMLAASAPAAPTARTSAARPRASGSGKTTFRR